MPANQINFPWFIIISTMVILMFTIGFFLFIIKFQRRQHKHMHEKNSLQSQFQQELLRTQLEIQEQTLKTISQEIHDNIGQGLSLVKLNLAVMDLKQPENLQEKIDDSKKLVGKAIQDLRDIAKSLNTDNIAAMGLVRAIEYELEMIRKTGSYHTGSDTKGTIIKLEPQKELILFRIVQETLNNIIKHANAKTINVKTIYSDKQLELTIMDDGDGFDMDSLGNGQDNNSGLGIRNMHSRAKLIGADFSMSSAAGSGTMVRLIVPFLKSYN